MKVTEPSREMLTRPSPATIVNGYTMNLIAWKILKVCSVTYKYNKAIFQCSLNVLISLALVIGNIFLQQFVRIYHQKIRTEIIDF